MNKKHKILFSICAVFIGIFSIFTGLAPLITYADSTTNYSVDFISPDNSILYEVNVSTGSSLLDLENSNLILNSAFLTNSNGQSSYTGSVYCVDNWRLGNSTFYVFTRSLVSTGSWQGIMQYVDNWENLKGQTVTASIKATSGASGIRFGLKNGSSDLIYTDGLVNSTGILSVTFTIPSNASYTNFNVAIWNKGAETTYLDYVKLEIGSSATGYFSQQYLNNLLSSYNTGNYFYTYDVDYSSSITSNKYYYPKQNFYSSDTWYAKTWNGISNLDGRDIFIIGSSNVYYSNQTFGNYVLDLSTSTWNQMSWGGLTSFNGRNVWTDGYDYYYSNNGNHYVLDVQTSTWTTKTWTGLTAFDGRNVWTDGNTYYLSEGLNQYVLDISNSTWSEKTWTGLTNFSGSNVWTDGSNFYLSSASSQYVLNVGTSTWTTKTWAGLTNFTGSDVWTDGTSYYYSYSSIQYVLNIASSTWTTKTWYNLNNYDGQNVWKFNDNIYFSGSNYQYVLNYSNTSDYYYENGYNQGYANGFVNGDSAGYNRGYSKGTSDAGRFTFFSLFGSIIDAPVNTLMSLFNFELLGVNLWSFFTGLLTLAVFIFVIKLILGGK